LNVQMPLEPEFVQYLASLNSSEAEFNSLPLVERSTIRRNFSSPPAPVVVQQGPCAVGHHISVQPQPALVKFSIDDTELFLSARDMLTTEFHKRGVKRTTLSPDTFEGRIWQREHCVDAILTHMDHIFYELLREKVCCGFGPMGLGKTMICDRLVNHAADLSSEFVTKFGPGKSDGKLVVLAVTFNSDTSLYEAIEGQLILDQKVALRLAFFWLYKGSKTFDKFLQLFDVDSLRDISFEAVLSRVVALCGCDRSLLMIDETLQSVDRVDLNDIVAVKEMGRAMSILVCQQHRLKVAVVFTSLALGPMLECKAFSKSQDATFYLPLLSFDNSVHLWYSYKREGVEMEVFMPVVFKSVGAFVRALVAACSGNPRLVYLAWLLAGKVRTTLSWCEWIHNLSDCFRLEYLSPDSASSIFNYRYPVVLVGLLGRSMTAELARSLKIVDNLTVEQLIAGGVYCASYNSNKSQVTPYMSQIALHAYTSFVQESPPTPEDSQLAAEINLALAAYTADSHGDRYELSVLASERVLRVVLQGVHTHFDLLLGDVPYHECTLQQGMGAAAYVKLDSEGLRTKHFNFSAPFETEIIHYDNPSALQKSAIQAKNGIGCYMPHNKQNPGFDSIMIVQDTLGGWLVIALENKFSLMDSTTAINWSKDVVDKADKTYSELRRQGWTESEIILVVTSWRKVSAPQKNEIVGALLAVPNYIVLTEDEQRKRLGATLSAIIDTWSAAGAQGDLDEVVSEAVDANSFPEGTAPSLRSLLSKRKGDDVTD